MMMAAAGSGRSEHWNVDTPAPLARQRESSSCPNVPCERRTDPAEPHEAPTPGASFSKPPADDMLEWLFLCK